MQNEHDCKRRQRCQVLAMLMSLEHAQCWHTSGFAIGPVALCYVDQLAMPEAILEGT